MRKFLLPYLAALMSLLVFDQALTADSPEEPTLSDRTAAHRLLNNLQALEMSSLAIDQMFNQYREMLPDVSHKVWNDLRTEFDTSELAPVMEEIYMRYFTADELNGLSEFFESPLGRLYIENQPSMLQESMVAGKLWAEGINKRLLAKLKDKQIVTPL